MDAQPLPQQICNRPFDAQALAQIRQIIHDCCEQTCFRSEIARRVCVALNWRNARGGLKEMGARVALLRLHRQGRIQLPPPRNGNGNQAVSPLAQITLPQPLASALHCALAELGRIRLQKVDHPTPSLLWNALIDQYHYLGHSPLSGAQVRYLIFSDRGLLGAIGFGAAAFAIKGRDDWIGWDRQQRNQRREFLLNNRRFLLLPWVRVQYLASHVLSKAAHQVQQDFPVQYGYTPLLLETFVEQHRFTGGCYRAANWIPVGLTTGRGRNDRCHASKHRRYGAPLPIK